MTDDDRAILERLGLGGTAAALEQAQRLRDGLVYRVELERALAVVLRLAAVVEAARALPSLQDAHYVNVVVRRNGRDEVYEADWLKPARAALAALDAEDRV